MHHKTKIIDANVSCTADFIHFLIQTESETSIEKKTIGGTIIRSQDPEKYYKAVELACQKDFHGILDMVDPGSAIKRLSSRIEVRDGRVFFEGNPVDNFAVRKILENPDERKAGPWVKFLESCFRNPHHIGVNSLFRFMENHESCPITEDGAFLAYKKVRTDFLSHFANSEGHHVDWTPGPVPVVMNREECDPDENNTCSSGLHFCSRNYLPNFMGDSGKVIVVKVFPEDVTAIPAEYDLAKGRCCRAFSMHEVPELKQFAFGDRYDKNGNYVGDKETDRSDSYYRRHYFFRILELIGDAVTKKSRSMSGFRVGLQSEMDDFIREIQSILGNVYDKGFPYNRWEVAHAINEWKKPYLESVEEQIEGVDEDISLTMNELRTEECPNQTAGLRETLRDLEETMEELENHHQAVSKTEISDSQIVVRS